LQLFLQNENPAKKPHSLPDIEAETSVAKPPFAQRRSSEHLLFLYWSALFANPVKSIFVNLFGSKFSFGSHLLKSL
jgi:hypothetical protein